MHYFSRCWYFWNRMILFPHWFPPASLKPCQGNNRPTLRSSYPWYISRKEQTSVLYATGGSVHAQLPTTSHLGLAHTPSNASDSREYATLLLLLVLLLQISVFDTQLMLFSISAVWSTSQERAKHAELAQASVSTPYVWFNIFEHFISLSHKSVFKTLYTCTHPPTSISQVFFGGGGGTTNNITQPIEN